MLQRLAVTNPKNKSVEIYYCFWYIFFLALGDAYEEMDDWIGSSNEMEDNVGEYTDLSAARSEDHTKSTKAKDCRLLLTEITRLSYDVEDSNAISEEIALKLEEIVSE